MGAGPDEVGRRVRLEQAEVAPARDEQQHAACTVDGRLEQRGGHRETRRIDRTVVAARAADAHQRVARILHDRTDVGEVEVDQSRRHDQVGDALHALEQDVVGEAERLEHRGACFGDLQQAVVRDDDERVDLRLERVDAGVGLGRAAPPFEGERPGDDTDGQRTEATGDARDERRRTRPGPATFSCRDEDHVGTGERGLDLVAVVLGRLATDVRIGARTQTTREVATDVELHVRIRHQQRLRVGVDRDELHTAQPGIDHAVDGVDTATPDADDLDDRQVVRRFLAHDRSLSHVSACIRTRSCATSPAKGVTRNHLRSRSRVGEDRLTLH